MAKAPRSETPKKPRSVRAAPKPDAAPDAVTSASATPSPAEPVARKPRGAASPGKAKPAAAKTAMAKSATKTPRTSVGKATRERTAGSKTKAVASAAKAAPPRGRAAKPAPSAPASTARSKRPAANGESVADINLGYLNEFVGFHLRLAQDASYRVFSRHRDKDLVKPGRFTALAIIQLNPGISQSALGRAIARDKSTVSPLIKDLQKNGFINRKASTNDKRSVTLALTKKGERTLTRLQARATEHENELDRLIGPSKPRFVNMLEKIVAGMTAQAPA